jgi:hypothetical protein
MGLVTGTKFHTYIHTYIHIAFHGSVIWSDDHRMWNKSKSHNTYKHVKFKTITKIYPKEALGSLIYLYLPCFGEISDLHLQAKWVIAT